MRNNIRRGTIKNTKDKKGLQEIEFVGLGDERATVMRLQEYGFTSVPLPGAECLVFDIGDKTQRLVVGVDDRISRVFNLSLGDVCIYTFKDKNQKKHRIHLSCDGDGGIIIVANNAEIKLNGDGDVLINCKNLKVRCDQFSVKADEIQFEKS